MQGGVASIVLQEVVCYVPVLRNVCVKTQGLCYNMYVCYQLNLATLIESVILLPRDVSSHACSVYYLEVGSDAHLSPWLCLGRGLTGQSAVFCVLDSYAHLCCQMQRQTRSPGARLT